MKKITIALLCGCAFALFAGDVELKNVINKSKIGDKTIRGWTVNKSRKDLGSAEVIQGSEKDEKAFKIIANTQDVCYYYLSGLKAKAGDKLEISAEIKGKSAGKFYLGYYTYTAKGVYFEAVQAVKSFAVTENKTEVKAEFVIQNGAKGQETACIRPFIRIDRQSEVIVEDIEVEVDYADKK